MIGMDKSTDLVIIDARQEGLIASVYALCLFKH